MDTAVTSTPLADWPKDQRVPGGRFLAFFALVLLGYALGGRGFAYLGVPPVFIGEFSLALGLVVLVRVPHFFRVFRLPQTAALLAWVGWCVARTAAGVPRYGVDALRDGVVWGYSTFAVVVGAVLLADPKRLGRLVAYYRRFGPVFLAGIPVVLVCYRFLGGALPRMHDQRVPLVQVKEADAMVHVGGIVAFWMVGFAGRVRWVWVLLCVANLAILGVVDRSGVVAFGAATGVCLVFRPRAAGGIAGGASPRGASPGAAVPWQLFSVMALGAVLLWATDFHFEMPDSKGREISFRQFVTNLGSITGDTGNDGLDGNKEWRLDWWREIRDYTIGSAFGRGGKPGPYFWTGKGFGINLADDDGFQVMADGSLRSPHSVHMMILARAGVPGLALWALSQLAWGWGVAAAYRHSRRAGHDPWARLFLFLGAYWLAFLVNGSFDVFIEGPMGGIWFWTIFGAGLAALGLYRHSPGALDGLVGADVTTSGPADPAEEDCGRAAGVPAAS